MPKTKQFEEAAVLEKAGRVFWEKGYNGTSMDELVTATGLSRSSIYDTFGDKHGLYLKSLEHYRGQQRCQLENSLGQVLSPRQKIVQFLEQAVAASLGDQQKKGCFILNCTTEMANQSDTVQSFVAGNMEAMEDLLAQWAKEGQTAGSISQRFSPQAIARYLFSTLNGLKVVAQARPDAAALHDVVKLALTVLD